MNSIEKATQVGKAHKRLGFCFRPYAHFDTAHLLAYTKGYNEK
jgi:hypothetical protein